MNLMNLITSYIDHTYGAFSVIRILSTFYFLNHITLNKKKLSKDKMCSLTLNYVKSSISCVLYLVTITLVL